MNPRSFRFFLPALAALFAFASSAGAAVPANLDMPYSRIVCDSSGADMGNTWRGDFHDETLNKLFDGNPTVGLKAPGIHAGYYLLWEYSDTNYVARIRASRLSDIPYEIYVSETGANWTRLSRLLSSTTDPDPLPSGKSLTTDEWGCWENVTKIKLVFLSNQSSDEGFSELEVLGYSAEEAEPQIISKKSLAKMYFSNGTMTGSNGTEGFGGGSDHGTIDFFFDGNFSEGIHIGPSGRLDNGGYIQLDFSPEKAGGYFITEIKTGSQTAHPYSLYYSMDGTHWTAVPGGTRVQAASVKSFPVNDTARYVKCVFDKIGGWTATFAELQVWGMDPRDVPCSHSFTEWTPVEGSATCTKDGIDEQFCTICETRATHESSTLHALGHDYVSHLEHEGAFKRFGGGYIDCSRCNWRLDFPYDADNPADTKPLDLITNRVDGNRIGRISVAGQYNFTEVTCTSTGNSAEEPNPNNDWGYSPSAVIDDIWTWSSPWYARLRDDQHVDYKFGTEIDLAWIDISVWNRDQFLFFYSVDDDTGEETLLSNFTIRRYDRDEGVSDQNHINIPEGEIPTPDIYGDRYYDSLQVVNDPQISSNGHNPYQRMILRFYEQPIKHLRVRQSGISETMRFAECHPWGTVKGAGDYAYDKRSIMIFR